ncbi:UvrABC system protein C [Rhodanobacter lindaniclasticus]
MRLHIGSVAIRSRLPSAMQPAQPPPFDGKAFVHTLTSSPGVYRHFDAAGELLYVGKAGNLKKRVGSYFLKPRMEPRIAAMVAQIAHVEITVTRTEGEALLLESQPIKFCSSRATTSCCATTRAIPTFTSPAARITPAWPFTAARRTCRVATSGHTPARMPCVKAST